MLGREAADALAKEARKNDLMLSSLGTVNGERSDNFVPVFSKGGKKGVNQYWLRMEKKSRSNVGREAADALAKEARKNDLMLSSLGTVNGERSDNFVPVFSKGGKKGVNQDCLVVWEEFGCQEDMIFCGIFDGHGPWGHLVAKRVRKLTPSSLLCNWQETLALNSLNLNSSTEPEKSLNRFNTWKQSYLKTCSAIDQDLEQHPGIDSFHSGTTALTIVRQGDLIVIANIGDSRAVLATTSDNGCLVWDVLSNREAVMIVSSTPEREESTKRLVQHAVCAWKCKKPGMAVDDISATYLFFYNSTSSQSVDTIKLP
ncbi:hypothetical protein TEA_012207 [Camellia sinensis var. sinensis]|uniref:PPM-type phosphatase domain-containing protein n=1 Tax=Camellia sinensis var. sinensis TaxID=542762 RepID=A0A4S4DKW2_CAMSN|nr:hypothetical protein TEA_012207 [Camellia sinensis var. sinensis]